MYRFLLVTFCLSLITSVAYNQNNNPADTGAYFKSFDSTRIYYEVKGTGDPVVLVHGFIVNGQSWKRTELYKDLLAKGYKVIILDQRGNGFSDKPEAYENDAEAKDIMALVKLLHIKKYSAIGYSRGSIIVSRLLVLDKKIKKGVMGGMGAEFTNPEWPRRTMFYKALSGEPVPELDAMVQNVKKQRLDQQALALLQKAQPSIRIMVPRKNWLIFLNIQLTKSRQAIITMQAGQKNFLRK